MSPFPPPFRLLDDLDLPAVLGILLPIILTLGAFLLVFGLRLISYRERSAMIEKGIYPGEIKNEVFANRPRLGSLPFGLIAIGVGIGLLLAYLFTNQTSFKGEPEPIYFGLVSIGGGIGVVASHFLRYFFGRDQGLPSGRSSKGSSNIEKRQDFIEGQEST